LFVSFCWDCSQKPAPPAPIPADPVTPSAPQPPQVSNPVIWLNHTTLAVNQQLDVKDRVGMWLPADVRFIEVIIIYIIFIDLVFVFQLIQIEGSNYKFHFHGWDPKWDETFDMSLPSFQYKIANFKQFSEGLYQVDFFAWHRV
jgi:hypothetical protein